MLITILSFIILISVVVFVHEFGHYLVAKVNGIQVDEFAIGYGKPFYSKKDKSGTIWKICYFPFGGFCKFLGDDDESSSFINEEKLSKMPDEDKKKCLYFKNVWQRIAVVSAGPIFNYFLSILCFTFVFFIQGKRSITNKITFIDKSSPAEISGMMLNDKIISIDNAKVNDFEDIQNIVALNVKDEMNIKVLRNTKEINLKIKFSSIKNKKLGVGSNDVVITKLDLFSSFIESLKSIYKLSKISLVAFGQIITGKRGLNEIGGPISIAKYSGEAIKNGFISFIYFIGLISTSLAIMNLLPIPLLDGGHIFFYLIEIIRNGKKLNQKVEMFLYKIGFGILGFLMLFSLFKDVFSLFK